MIKDCRLHNVPALRFPEFSGEWENQRLGDTCTFFSGGTPASSKKEYYGGNIPFIRSGELHSESTALYITEEAYNSCSAKMVNIGDLLLALYGATSGDISICKIKGAINQAILCIRPDNLDTYFIKSLWEKHKEHILQTYLQGGQGNLSSEIVKNICFRFPNAKEQSKISNLFQIIDERIATQSKIIEEQETLLKSLRYKLFNQCSDSFTQCRIGDILSIGSGKDYQHLSEGDIPVYGTGGLMCYVNESLHDGESVCIGRKGTINKPLFLRGKFWTVDTLFYTHSFNGVLPRFCYHLFCTIDWLTYNEASGVPSLSKSTIEKIPILIPTIEMQGKIVQILDTIEEKVDTDRKTLRNYQNQKAYLLSRMFI